MFSLILYIYVCNGFYANSVTQCSVHTSVIALVCRGFILAVYQYMKCYLFVVKSHSPLPRIGHVTHSGY